MKPTFALDLTREAIALLHRTPKGWISIGEVAFDAPDMAEALDYLRKTALGLSPMGFATKIILPNSQILYTEVEAPGPSRSEKRRQIAAGLEGRTPYAVEDLVFDWSGKGATVKVAVVARETLDEAEGFAAGHRLNPVSFVAIPEDGAFVGEPWFGPTATSEAILAPGEGVDRDREAVTILHRDLPPAASPEIETEEAVPAAVTAETALQDEATDEPTVSVADKTVDEVTDVALDVAGDDDPLPGLEEALNADLSDPLSDTPAAAEPASDQPPAHTQAATAEGDPDLADDLGLDEDSLAAALAEVDTATPDTGLSAAVPVEVEAAPVSDEPLTGEPESVWVAPKAPTPSLTPAQPAAADVVSPLSAPSGPVAGPAPVSTLKDADADEAPFAHVTDPAAFPEADDDIPPAPPSAAMVAFASRRSGGATPAAGSIGGATRSDSATVPPPASGAKLGQPIPRPAAAKGFAGLVTAPSIPGTRAKPKAKTGGASIAASTATGPTTVKSPARPGGTFGNAAPPRNRSGVVFMVLVALLLIFLALVAAWSSFYLARGSSSQSDAAFAGLDTVPDIDDEMLADLQDPADLGGTSFEADPDAVVPGDAGALATETLPVDLGDEISIAEAPEVIAEEIALAEPVDLLADTVAETDAAIGAEADAEIVAEMVTEAGAETAAEVATEVMAEARSASEAEPAPGTAVTTELSAAQPPVEDQDEIFLSAMDAPPPALDARSLPLPEGAADAAPDTPMPPPAFGTVYQFDANGLLKPTPAGILSPDGVMLIAGKPPRLPPARSDVAAAAAAAALAEAAAAAPEAAPEPQADETAPTVASVADASLVTAGEEPAVEAVPADPALAGFRPRARPEGLVPEADDDASLSTEAASDFAALRPLTRPDSVVVAASASRPATVEPADLGAQAASLTAQAEAQLAAATALEAQNPSVVAISKRPQGRPRDLSRAVEAAVAAAVREPEPKPVVVAAAAPAPGLKPEELDEIDEPQNVTAAPKIPTKASVAKQATFTKAINLSKLNLIGTYGTDSRRTALIRQSNGRYKKVKVGDKIDGGTIMAITETEVRYQKGGKLLALAMPKT